MDPENSNNQKSNITSKTNITLAKCKKYYIKYLLPLNSLECSKKYLAIQNQSRLRTLTSLFVYEYLTTFLTEDITLSKSVEEWTKKYGRTMFLKDPNPIRRSPLDAFFKLTDLCEVYQDVAALAELEVKPQGKVLVFGFAVLKHKTLLACVEALLAKPKARFFHKLHRYSRSSMVALGHAKNWDTQYIRRLNHENKLRGERMLLDGKAWLDAQAEIKAIAPEKHVTQDFYNPKEPFTRMDFLKNTKPLSFHDKMQELHEADIEAARNTPPCQETSDIVGERLTSIVAFKHARTNSLDETKKTTTLIDNLVEDSFDGITRSIRSILVRHRDRKRALKEAEDRELNRRTIKTIELRKLSANTHNVFRIPSFIPISLCEECGLYVVDPDKCASMVPTYELETRARKQVAIEAIREDVNTLFSEYERLITKKQTVYQEQIEAFFK